MKVLSSIIHLSHCFQDPLESGKLPNLEIKHRHAKRACVVFCELTVVIRLVFRNKWSVLTLHVEKIEPRGKDCRKVVTFAQLCHCSLILLIGSISKIYQNIR